MIRWIWEETDSAIGHLLLLLRGCQHPKFEDEDMRPLYMDGEFVIVYTKTCTVCGRQIVSTT